MIHSDRGPFERDSKCKLFTGGVFNHQVASSCRVTRSLSTVSNGVLALVLKPLGERSPRNVVSEHTPTKLELLGSIMKVNCVI